MSHEPVSRQLKKIAFLVPRQGLTLADFSAYWRNVHGPVVAGSPGYGTYRRRYVQDHVGAAGPVGEAFAYAGMAEFWLPGATPNEEAFAASEIYRERIRVDEERFIDMGATLSMTALEQVARPGTGAVKIVIVSERATDLVPPANLDEASARFVDAALGASGFSASLRGWRIDHALAGSFRLPGARPAGSTAIDRVQSLWFDTLADARTAFGSPAYRNIVAPRERELLSRGRQFSFVANELVFFDRGEVVARRAPASDRLSWPWPP
ncbi:conserved hypothetical protein [Rhizobiales bacterium GAS113]|nr:conserved hypothetical protein [Rhizobiales bacterium GAS113]